MDKVWPILLGLLTHIASCTEPHLERDLLHMHPARVARHDQVRHAGMVGNNEFILVTGEPDIGNSRVLIRIDAEANEHSLVLPAKDTACLGEALIVRAARWWYSGCSGNGIRFVTSDRPDSPSFVADNRALHPKEWLPFEQDDPGGVLLSTEQDGRVVVVRSVTPSGMRETLGRFDRGSAVWGANRGQAVRLAADGVALITIETISDDPAHSSIVLRILRNGEISTSRVAFHASAWRSVAAAAGPTGQLAIVGAPFDDSGLVAVVVDQARPDKFIARALMRRPEAVSTDVRLIANGDRFIAGWISRDGQVQIAEFGDEIALPAVTVAIDAARRAPTISLGHAPGDGSLDVTVFWPGDTGHVMLRRLPEPPTGSLIASDLLRALFDRAERWVRKSKAGSS